MVSSKHMVEHKSSGKYIGCPLYITWHDPKEPLKDFGGSTWVVGAKADEAIVIGKKSRLAYGGTIT